VLVAWILAYTVSLTLAVVGWGLFIRHRRQLIVSLQDRAARAETEARLRAEQAQLQAREQIAREMHDVLGHRLSLLSVHAGALEYRPDAPAAEVAGAAKVIRETTHQALQDLREVLGVLRAPAGELPQPTLADVRELVASSGRAGMRVELREEATGAVPDRVGRTAYRIVQEALTNALKHAPGAEVRVRLAGARGRGLTVEVANTAPAHARARGGGAGQGLVGLAERVSQAGDGAEALALVDRHAPDVVLMDIRMPGMDGLVATEALRGRGRAPEVIVLTTFDADEHVLRALRAGAAGFLLKDTPPTEIVAAIREVARGNPVLSPAVTRRLMARAAATDHDRRRAQARDRLALLADREREVAAGVGQGKSNAEIGAALYLSVPTVKTHVSSILTKLDLNNRVQIALLVHDAGLLDDQE
jgi:DNA-binding NarL/FixJ family response regulator/two-component sensor histidine kinase